MIEEDAPSTFSEEDFERRYSPGEASGAPNLSRSGIQSTKPIGTEIGRSRNRYMRTLLRRRLITVQSRT